MNEAFETGSSEKLSFFPIIFCQVLLMIRHWYFLSSSAYDQALVFSVKFCL